MIFNSCKRKILICTPSNKAVDEILTRLSAKGLLGTEMEDKDLIRVGSSEYQAEETIKKHSLDQRVNRVIKEKKFESCERRKWIIEKMSTIDGTPLEIVQEMSAEYIHPVSKRIKISSESNQFFEELVDLMQDFPENEEEIDLSEIKTLMHHL
jgi:hypothetical protein